jgi:diadenosine tetraphosphatase ApaH/serine/threonine PP2A family protein phosphatase
MDIDRFIAGIRSRGNLDEQDVEALFALATDILYQEGTIISVTAPITVCGDVHGQLYDVFRLLEIGGPPANTKYLFLGDYVDRGHYSIETFCLLLAYKVKYPKQIFLLRGNHECRQVNQQYGFFDELIARFGHPGIYKVTNEVFDFLPMAAVIDNKIFCVHGGLSPDIRAIEQIATFDQKSDIPSSGPLSDLVWSDPDDIAEWAANQRGAGFVFGRRPTTEFLQNNKLKFMARAHQMQEPGYAWLFEDKLVTVWSAPNYMYRCKNKASVMAIDASLNPTFQVFDEVPDYQRTTPDETPCCYFA